MSSNKDLIDEFIDRSVITKRDCQLMDIFWIFLYCLPSKTAYKKYRETFKKWLGNICKRNLQKRHNLSDSAYKEKMTIFLEFLNTIPDFLAYDTYDDDKEDLGTTLTNKTAKMLTENATERLRDTSELDTQILSFVLKYIPLKIEESLRKAEEMKVETPSYIDKYMWLPDFKIIENRETSEILHFIIGMREWTYLFNQIFNQELKEYRFKSKYLSDRPHPFYIVPYDEYDEVSFWQFGDELARLGVGYWKFGLGSSSGNLGVDFIISKFIYDVILPYKEKLPYIESIDSKISEIAQVQAEDGYEWSLQQLEDRGLVTDFSEADIEVYIASNPGVLEDSLSVEARQYPTSIGFIDILCRDKEENFVVVELKRVGGSFEVVGQIQKYMAWIDEKLAKGKQVRGIIVAKAQDEQLEYAIKGSKFPIDIKIFGDEPPIEGNMRYCDKCGKANRKSAVYCIKCGNKFWL